MSTSLSQLPKTVSPKKKRLGRGLGSGKGAKSTRGTTRHQRAREAIPLHFEGGQGRLVKKYPLLRGKARNKPSQKKPVVIYLSKLNVFKDGDTVTIETLTKKGILRDMNAKTRVKILANGKLEKKLIVQLPLSQSAKKMVENAGGEVKV